MLVAALVYSWQAPPPGTESAPSLHLASACWAEAKNFVVSHTFALGGRPSILCRVYKNRERNSCGLFKRGNIALAFWKRNRAQVPFTPSVTYLLGQQAWSPGVRSCGEIPPGSGRIIPLFRRGHIDLVSKDSQWRFEMLLWIWMGLEKPPNGCENHCKNHYGLVKTRPRDICPWVWASDWPRFGGPGQDGGHAIYPPARRNTGSSHTCRSSKTSKK